MARAWNAVTGESDTTNNCSSSVAVKVPATGRIAGTIRDLLKRRERYQQLGRVPPLMFLPRPYTLVQSPFVVSI